jgi:hypothetical protein
MLLRNVERAQPRPTSPTMRCGRRQQAFSDLTETREESIKFVDSAGIEPAHLGLQPSALPTELTIQKPFSQNRRARPASICSLSCTPACWKSSCQVEGQQVTLCITSTAPTRCAPSVQRQRRGGDGTRTHIFGLMRPVCSRYTTPHRSSFRSTGEPTRGSHPGIQGDC